MTCKLLSLELHTLFGVSYGNVHILNSQSPVSYGKFRFSILNSQSPVSYGKFRFSILNFQSPVSYGNVSILNLFTNSPVCLPFGFLFGKYRFAMYTQMDIDSDRTQ